MTAEDLMRIGFNSISHYTIMNSYIYDLGRGRQISIGCVGSPNEMMWICEVDPDNPKNITDLVCLHNWDYDGELKEDKVTTLINLLTNN